MKTIGQIGTAFVMALSLLFSPAAAAQDEATISVVLDGFNPDGSTKTGPYGIAKTQEAIQKVAALLHIPDGSVDPKAPNQIVQMQYYGDTPPDYYTAKDIEEVKAAGKGTPRYALIAAKFIQHRLTSSGAKKVNLAGGSYGGLISRYIIEHNVGNLAGSGKIIRWLSIEGAVTGAYPANMAADPKMKSFLIDVLGYDISDPLTMHYEWVAKNVNNPRDETRCPHFKNILIAHHLSGNDDLNGQMLTTAENVPNDGVLLHTDMVLRSMPTSCQFHNRMPVRVITDTTHLSIRKDPALVLTVASLIRGTKRATIRMVKGKATQFNEDELFFGKGEVVFQGNVHSPFAASVWGIDREMTQLSRKHHTAPVIKCKVGETKEINAVVFDWPVNPEEKCLNLKFWAEEVDWDDMYKIHEDFLNPYEDLGSASLEVPVQTTGKQLYEVKTPKWELWVEVEVYDYGKIGE